MFAWLPVSPFTKITYILTSLAHFSKQFLRDIREAEPWAIVLILSQVKLNSQLSHGAFFCWQLWQSTKRPREDFLPSSELYEEPEVDTHRDLLCPSTFSESSDEFRVSLSCFLHLTYRLMILSSIWWSIIGIWPPVERYWGDGDNWKTLGKLPTQLKEISLLSSKTLSDLGLSVKIGGWSDTFPQLTVYMDITRWSTLKSDWLYSLQPKMEKLYTVSKNKTRRWLWLRSWTPYCKIQT